MKSLIDALETWAVINQEHIDPKQYEELIKIINLLIFKYNGQSND